MSYYSRHRDPDDLGDQLHMRSGHILLAATIVSGLLVACGVSAAMIVFAICLVIWATLVVGVTGAGGLLLFSSPYVYLGIATLLITIIAAPFILSNLIIIFPIVCLVAVLTVINEKVTKYNEQQLRINFWRNKELGSVAPNSTTVAPLDETNLQAFRNTDAYKKAQLAYSSYTKEQAAAYKKTQPAYPTSETTKQYASY